MSDSRLEYVRGLHPRSCSEYRGSTVPFKSCLNLRRPQFAMGSNSAPATTGQNAPFKPRFGPQPAVPMQAYRPATAAKHHPRTKDQPQSLSPATLPTDNHTTDRCNMQQRRRCPTSTLTSNGSRGKASVGPIGPNETTGRSTKVPDHWSTPATRRQESHETYCCSVY